MEQWALVLLIGLAIASLIVLILLLIGVGTFAMWLATFVRHLFRKEKKLDEMDKSNKSFSLDQGKEQQ